MIDRRTFLGASVALAIAPLDALAEATALDRALASSRFAYISPLHGDGRESTCHGEVWFAWIDGALVVNTAVTTWKAKAVEKGLSRARIWVGDRGRWKRMGVTSDGFRQAPTFDAKVERSLDAALLEKLVTRFDEKYPKDFDRWRERMRKGFEIGDRALLRYTPV